jgi:hypothetical protein
MREHLATTAILTGIVAGTLAGTAGVAAAAPADTCNAYSSTCPSPSVSGLHFSKPPQGPQVEGTSQSQLPFTGGEIAGMAILGLGAVGAGVVFVTTGRRRRAASH